MGRLASVIACTALCATVSYAGAPARALDATDTPVLISGTGAAHGLGMAMDGVLGQARAGWTADRILSLFYSGSVPGRAAGEIRVGLALGGRQGLTLPSGGVVSDAAAGQTPSQGFPITAKPGARVVVSRPPEGLNVAVSGVPAVTAARAIEDGTGADPTPGVLTPPPAPLPTATPKPTPTPSPTPTPKPKSAPSTSRSSLWVVPTGNLALTHVDATGRRYRGAIEIRRDPAGGLRVVNHVDLETYVMGIAEEKGAGWPNEGLKVLAIAARSLGAATMSWMSNNHPNGYDICPNENCQVYLGYDGEEPALTRAVRETAGQIRTHRGRPILAMYHGNGGGETESYGRLSNLSTDPYPYLKAVKYPFAKPSHWEVATTYRRIAELLGGAGNDVPLPLVRTRITERGDSPRVIKMKLVSDHDEVKEVSGQTFARALKLRSTWFDISSEGREVARAIARLKARGERPIAMGAGEALAVPPRRSSSMLAAALGLLTVALVVFAVTQHREQIAARVRSLVRR